MNIQEKIAQIRLEPEHIRLRYVWGAVAISMFFIVGIWIFSMGFLFQGDSIISNPESSTIPDIVQQLQDLKQQAPSIKDFSDQPLVNSDEGISNASIETEFNYPATANEPEIPQASAYSKLPTE